MSPLRSQGAPWQEIARQAVLVSTNGWEDTRGTLSTWQRQPQGWVRVLDGVSVTLGRAGTGVGVGLHRDGLAGPQKREGDKRAPAGVFPLEFSFGTLPQRTLRGGRFPFRRTSKTTIWIDDPNSAHYNQWLDLSEYRNAKDWNSAEKLLLSSDLYELAIVVGHNRRQPIVSGAGSAIFVHRWSGPGHPTIGCTAMDPKDLLSLWKWLDPEAAPVWIQGPVEFLPSLNIPVPIR